MEYHWNETVAFYLLKRDSFLELHKGHIQLASENTKKLSDLPTICSAFFWEYIVLL